MLFPMLCLLSTSCLPCRTVHPWCVRLSPPVALWLLYGLIPSTDLLDGFDALSDSDLSLTSKVLPQGLVPCPYVHHTVPQPLVAPC